jgi:hypothetical protein
VLAGIAIGACAQHLRPALEARAAGEHRCDYTYIQDTSAPNIGEGGELKYDEDWERVLSAGWNLKALNGNNLYIFERCR